MRRGGWLNCACMGAAVTMLTAGTFLYVAVQVIAVCQCLDSFYYCSPCLTLPMAGDVMACLTCSFLIFIYSVIKAGASWHCILATYDFNLSLELELLVNALESFN
jgi:hypothetical protein